MTPHDPPQLSPEQQFLEGLNALPTPGGGGTPPPLPAPTARIGDKDYTLDDLAKLIAAQDQELQRMKKLGQLPEPELPEPTPAPVPAPTPGKPSRWTMAQWAEKVSQDPISAQDHALGQAFGLPEGVPASAALTQLTSMVVDLKQKLEGQTLRTQQEILQREAERFMESNKDYDATPENSQILGRYLQSAGAQHTAQGLSMAYKAAVADGVIRPKSTKQEATPQGQTQQQQNRLPSLRPNQGTGDGEPTDFAPIKRKLDSMSPSEADDYIARFERSLGKHK